MLAIRLTDDIKLRLNKLAEKTGRTKTFYAREAIYEHLDDLEDWYLAEQISIDVSNGKEETYSLEEVMQEYGMEV